MFSKELTLRLRRIYMSRMLSNYGITFAEFIKFAESQEYKPWKELVVIDKNKAYSLDNLRFSYATLPTKKQMGLEDARTRESVSNASERVFILRAVGKLLVEHETLCCELESLLKDCQNDFELETMQTFLAYIGATRRGFETCLDYMDGLEVTGKFIADRKKTDKTTSVKHQLIPASVALTTGANTVSGNLDSVAGQEAEEQLLMHDFRNLSTTGVDLWGSGAEQEENNG